MDYILWAVHSCWFGSVLSSYLLKSLTLYFQNLAETCHFHSVIEIPQISSTLPPKISVLKIMFEVTLNEKLTSV